jgi:chaperone modulatory protein CbpM
MTERFSEDEVVATVTRLTRPQLSAYVEAAFVRPQKSAQGYVYRRIDIARLELLCDLSDDLDLDETALTVVLSLIDQLHAARQDLAHVAQAMQSLPDEHRAELLAALKAG